MRSAKACQLPTWPSCVALPRATARTRYVDGKSKAPAGRRPNYFVSWRWQAIDIPFLKISTSSTASISTRKIDPRAERRSARTCGTRSGAVWAEAIFRAVRGGLWLHRVRTQRVPRVLLLHVRDLVQHLFESIDRGSFLMRQWRLGMEMREQHGQRITDTADLPAISADIRQHLLFHAGIARLAKVDIDHTQLASDRTEESGERIDRLHHISGKRHLKRRHAQTPVSATACSARELRLHSDSIKAPLSKQILLFPNTFGTQSL